MENRVGDRPGSPDHPGRCRRGRARSSAARAAVARALLLPACSFAALLAPGNARAALEPPVGFPRFSMPGHEERARILSEYLWYHFQHRLGNGVTLFNKEYLLSADSWLEEARPRGDARTIQEVHRASLLAVRVDPSGYVETHQHFSHAHDGGWPFPLWTQAGRSAEEARGVTAGWHFKPVDAIRVWVGGQLKRWGAKRFWGEGAVRDWELHHLRSRGIVENAWKLEASGPSPALLSPADVAIDAFNSPWLQIRWRRTGTAPGHRAPWVEWLREGDREFGPDRRVRFYPERTALSGRFFHSLLPMYRHPLWKGKIRRLRISLAPGESEVELDIDSIFTVYDTRHTINNPILILAGATYFAWTGDLDFLRQMIGKLRLALRYQQTVMGGLEHRVIRNPWPGHDGRPGWVRGPDGKKQLRPGHGIGNNYWDILPFGGDDFYATGQYYAATLRLAELEEAIRAHPAWDVPGGALALDPERLRRHAAEVKEEANRRFWSPATGRFVACLDADGTPHDFGFTFVNLDSVWYGIASDDHARDIVDWISGRRVVAGDTSTGADIYRWRFGPRSTTRRNVEWYGHAWYAPESIPWGGQVQDGGAVLGFTFYDLWARLRVRGADDAWKRLEAILDWEAEVRRAGGYRAYYEGGKRGTTLQGGGTAGGLGIDHEFYESSLLPSIVVYGFLGLEPRPDRLDIAPRLPEACPSMGVRGLRWRGERLDLAAGPEGVTLTLARDPVEPLAVRLPGAWRCSRSGTSGSDFTLDAAGAWRFEPGK